jgi:surfeit locus 1 family protein
MIAASMTMTNAFMIAQSNPPPRRPSTPRASAAGQRGTLRGALPTLATFALVAIFVAAAVWQHARMREREARAAALAEASRMAPVPVPHGVADWAAWRYRRVELAGHYDARHSILIDNAIDAGRVGFEVVTPFLLDDGRAVLVERGFVGAGPSRATLPQVPTPAGPQRVRGRIELPGRYVELARTSVQGVLWQNLDPARFAAATGLAVLPIVVLQDRDDAPGDGLARDWPAPDEGASRNFSYMLQWIAFALLALGLWAWFGPPRRWLRK